MVADFKKTVVVISVSSIHYLVGIKCPSLAAYVLYR